MDILRKETRTINIVKSDQDLLSIFLRVFLAQIRLTDKQLDVAGALISRYAVYAADGVKEPYASTLLFSTQNRKEIVDELGISAPHLNNTFSSLEKKGILGKDGSNFILDPGLIPCNQLVFNFQIQGKVEKPAEVEEVKEVTEDAKQGQDNKRSSGNAKPTVEPSSGSDNITIESSSDDDTEEGTEDYISEEDRLSSSDSGSYEDSPGPRRAGDYT